MQKSFPWIYLTMIVLVMIGLYLIIVPLLLFHYHPFSPFPLVIFIIIYHLALFLLIWSMVETIRIDSGRVPIKWVYIILDLGIRHGNSRYEVV